MIYRTEIEKALDELISNEAGMKFQGLAVILAKQKWPDLIACERKKDLGLDAYAPASLDTNGIGKVFASSITATIDKIKTDAKGVKENFDDIKVFIFATPQKVTNQTAQKWAEEIWDAFGYELIVMPREDVIASLMSHPNYVSLCRTELGIAVAIEASMEELRVRALAATSEQTANWLTHPRIARKPLTNLRISRPTQENRQPDKVLSLNDILVMLSECRRLILEAPAGRGKTTSLIQLANLSQGLDRLSFLIDLREWAESGQEILDFIVRSPEFRSHGINAEDLAKLSKVTHFSFLLNGWNEISEGASGKAEVALRNLERSFPAAGIIVATRNHHISPPLPGVIRTKLLPLTKAQRADYLQRRLAGRADELVMKLDNDPVLDELTQTFLFLAEVTTIFESGHSIPPTKMGVLKEVIHLLERSEEHCSYLQRVPLKGRVTEYLEGLATEMTTQGATRVSRQEACAFISSASRRLRDKGQIESAPDPDDILNTLCAHHILERPDYSSEAISFEHQQFQEFYAAQSLKKQLGELIQSDDQDRKRDYTRQYVNERSWEEPLCMIAEEIGTTNAESTIGDAAVKIGKLLVEMALRVDPIFAAQLARLCGELVWKQVRAAVSRCLRSWYAVDDEHHRQCAVAGMLASGSDEFSDILLPLLSSDDQQVRLKTSHAGGEFHLSSLGARWRDVVRGWGEEARSDFINEMAFNRRLPLETAAEFALTDPSPGIRLEVLQTLSWIDDGRHAAWLLEALDEVNFSEVIQKLFVERIPVALRSRAITVYQKVLSETAEVMNRIQVLLQLVQLGDTGIAEKLKQELTQLSPDKINDRAEPLLQPALKLVQSIEPEWVSDWVARQITDGLLRQESWMPFVTCISESLKAKLLNRVACEELGYYRLSDFASVLAATGDFTLVEAVFAKLCDVRRGIDETRPQDSVKRTIAIQLEDLFRSFPPSIAAAGLLKCFAKEFDAIEFTSVIEIFSGFDSSKADLRSQIPNDLRQKLRAYLKSGVQFALEQDDRFGRIKAHLATAFAKVGDPEDMIELRQLIDADTEKFRNANLHAEAVALLDPGGAISVLEELLNEPEYEIAVAKVLVRLATIQDRMNRFSYTTEYHFVWEARAGHPPRQFDEERRQRFADAIKQRMAVLLDESAKNLQKSGFFYYKLKELAESVATLDSQNSAGLVLEIMALAGESSEWGGVRPLKNLLFGGATLPTESTLKILDLMIERLCKHGLYSDQIVGSIRDCLCLMPFVDSPSIGINRVRQVLTETKFPKYKLPDIMAALGESRCHEALALLKEFEPFCNDDSSRLKGDWLNAIAGLESPEATEILLSFVSPNAKDKNFEKEMEFGYGRLLALHIADRARTEIATRQRIFELCALPLSSSKRDLLAKVIAKLGTEEAILAGLNLMDDARPILYDLREAVERVFVEQRPYGKSENSFTLVPRSSNAIRSKLFEMGLTDDKRKRSAFNLLGQIEVWRLDYGRSETEPRHPLFNSDELWPLGLRR